jgi:hypothetical protein
LGHPHLGPPFGTLILDLDLGHPHLGHPHLGPLFWTLILDLDLGHPHLEPQFGDELFQGAQFRYCKTLLQGIIVGPRRPGGFAGCYCWAILAKLNKINEMKLYWLPAMQVMYNIVLVNVPFA